MKCILEEMEEKILQIKAMNEEDEEPTIHDIEMFKDQIDDEMIGEFVDALLIKMGELEQEGRIHFKKTKDVKAAVVALIRKMSAHSSIITRMTNKFQRFGSRRFLRRARAEISKVL